MDSVRAPEGRRFVVVGRVQGVGFRWFVCEQARAQGCAGFVCNQPDGTVLGEAAGPSDRLTRLEQLLKVGPSGARVTHVMASPIPFDSAHPMPFPFELRS